MPMNNLRAYRVYLIHKAITHGLFLMAFTVNDLYRLLIVQLDPLQLVLAGTVLEVSIFLFEIPTGAIADLYSRRLSVIIGVFLIGAGFILEGSFPFFSTILVAQVLWGIGLTFTSGALEAWITDEIGEENSGATFLRGTQVSQIGGIVGITFSTIIGLSGINYPIIFSGLLFIILGFYLIIAMPETGFKPARPEERSTFNNMKTTIMDGFGMIRKRPSLRSILWIGLFFGLYSEGLDRLWVAHLVDGFSLPYFQPVVWMGLIWGTSMLLTIGMVELVKSRIDMVRMQSLVKALMISSGLILMFLFLFASSGFLWLAIFLYLAIDVLRQLNEPIYTAWINHKLDPQIRATVLSMSTQLDAFGQIAGGPITGWIGRLFSIRAALYTSCGLLSPVLYLFGRHIRARDDE